MGAGCPFSLGGFVGQGAQPPSSAPSGLAARDPLPDAEPSLAEAYSCEILHSTKGLLKGSWGTFTATAFHRRLPDDGVRTIRHVLIHVLEIASFAEKNGEVAEAEFLGEGSFAKVYGAGGVAAKVISSREKPWVHKAAVENALEADRLGVGPRVYGHGLVKQTIGGSFQGTAVFMERLCPLGEAVWSDEDSRALLGDVHKLAAAGFHNDVKLDNVLRRWPGGKPLLIDFDLMDGWSIKVAVTSSCIEHNFRELLEPLGAAAARDFREYYDLFALSLTIEDGGLYLAVLARLEALWAQLEQPVLRPLRASIGEEKLTSVPFEVLIRVNLHGVTVNLLDLMGNLFAHLAAEDRVPRLPAEEALRQSERLPQLLKSNGVYWP